MAPFGPALAAAVEAKRARSIAAEGPAAADEPPAAPSSEALAG